MITFTELLEEYLGERDRQNNDYYEGRYFQSQIDGRERMANLAKQIDEMVDPILKEKNK